MSWLRAMPAMALAVLAAMFFRDVSSPSRGYRPSSLVGEQAPLVTLPALDSSLRRFTSADLRAGHVSVINVWASWCVPCRAEVPSLDVISRTPGAELYGIAYEDKPTAARKFLLEEGDPFSRLDLDAEGSAGKAWGVYGLPETFVVDGRGFIRLRFAGPIEPGALRGIIMPAIASASHQS